MAYTTTVKNKSIQRTNRQLIVDIEFNDGTSTFEKSFAFPLYTTIDQIKKVIKQYIEELESGKTLEPQIPDGEIDLSTVPDGPTQAEQNKILWLQRDALWEKVQIAIDKGYLTGSETKVTQLQNWLRTNFKPEYIDLV